jgi:hypothetical protein
MSPAARYENRRMSNDHDVSIVGGRSRARRESGAVQKGGETPFQQC